MFRHFPDALAPVHDDQVKGVTERPQHREEQAHELDFHPLRGFGQQDDTAECRQDGHPGLPARIQPQGHHDQGDEYGIQIHERRCQPAGNEFIRVEQKQAAASEKDAQQDQHGKFPPPNLEGLFPQAHPHRQQQGRQEIPEEQHHQHRDAALQQRLRKQRIRPVRDPRYDACDITIYSFLVHFGRQKYDKSPNKAKEMVIPPPDRPFVKERGARFSGGLRG